MSLNTKKRGVKAGTKRGTYKTRTKTVDKLNEYLAELPRALNMCIKYGSFRPRAFYKIADLKERFGYKAVALHREWFESSRVINYEKFDELKGMWRRGVIDQKKFNELKHTCYKWRWSIKKGREIEAAELVDEKLCAL